MPQILLGFDALEPDDADRLRRYLAALVAQRRIVHAAIAFNAVYFGYDLDFGGYVGGPVEFDRFEQVAFGETTAALPVGAMVTVAAGGNPLYAEVVYKEGAHPELGDDGGAPAWLSGAPGRAGASEEGTEPGAGTVLAERLVIDCDAFGKSLVTSQAQWDRLRRRGKWLDGSGHLLLDAHYDSANDAETDDTEFYARYLLTRGRGQLLAGPLPLVLSEEAGRTSWRPPCGRHWAPSRRHSARSARCGCGAVTLSRGPAWLTDSAAAARSGAMTSPLSP